MCLIMINLSATFSQTNGLEPGEEFSGRIVPAEGAADIFVVSTPNAFHHRVIDIQRKNLFSFIFYFNYPLSIFHQ